MSPVPRQVNVVSEPMGDGRSCFGPGGLSKNSLPHPTPPSAPSYTSHPSLSDRNHDPCSSDARTLETQRQRTPRNTPTGTAAAPPRTMARVRLDEDNVAECDTVGASCHAKAGTRFLAQCAINSNEKSTVHLSWIYCKFFPMLLAEAPRLCVSSEGRGFKVWWTGGQPGTME